MNRSFALIAIFGILTACGAPAKDDRQKVLRATTDEVILPSLDRLKSDTKELEIALGAYCENPIPDGLSHAQAAWRVAREAYKLTSSFEAGPSEAFVTATDFWPVREADVERVIASAPEVPDRAYLSTLGVSAKGFPVLEYLLFKEPVALATPSTTSDRVRCNYAAAVATDIAEQASLLHDAWSRDGFAEELADPNEYGTAVTSSRAGVDLLLNATTAALVDLTDKTLARPLGEKSDGVPQPETCESRYSANTTADYLAALASVHRVWVGALEGEKGRGLTLLVRKHNIQADERVRRVIIELAARINNLQGGICEAIIADPSSVSQALDSARSLRRLMTTEVVQVMGGTLTFSDNDGD